MSDATSINPHVLERLNTDVIVWLTSTRADGRPHIVPVWFLWDGEKVLIFSQPNNQKVRNLRHSTQVMLALDNTQQGSDVVMFEGQATLHAEPFAALPPAYLEKYGAMIQSMGWQPEGMAQTYSQAISITPTRFLAW